MDEMSDNEREGFRVYPRKIVYGQDINKYQRFAYVKNLEQDQNISRDIERHLTLVIRSCYTIDHYLTTKDWITDFFRKIRMPMPKEIDMELTAAFRRIPKD